MLRTLRTSILGAVACLLVWAALPAHVHKEAPASAACCAGCTRCETPKPKNSPEENRNRREPLYHRMRRKRLAREDDAAPEV